MAFLKTVGDQVALNFTGRINIMEKTTGKYLGRVSLLEGKIVFCNYRGSSGKASLFHVVIDDMELDSLTFIVEPEIVSAAETIFELDYDQLVAASQNVFQAYQDSKRLRPPDHIRLLIDPDFISVGPNISYWEFETLAVISDFNKVEDIFRESPLLEYQTCNSLVSLRKKKAIKVLSQ